LIHQNIYIYISARAAQEFERSKTNLKNETFYLKFIFQVFLMKIYILNYHN